jgi:thioredoxin
MTDNVDNNNNEENLGPECEREIQETIQSYNLQLENAIQHIKEKYRNKTNAPLNLVHKVDSHDEFKKILEKAGDNLVVVDFTATWCGPCKRIAPRFKELSQKHTNVVFLKIDVDDNPDTTEECEISSMPTFQFYKQSLKIDEFSGANEQSLKDKIVKHQ